MALHRTFTSRNAGFSFILCLSVRGRIIAEVMAYAVMLSIVVVLCRPILDRWGWINKKHRACSVLFVVVVFTRLFVGFFGGGVGAVAHGGRVVI